VADVVQTADIHAKPAARCYEIFEQTIRPKANREV
jgi:hypothetical protein